MNILNIIKNKSKGIAIFVLLIFVFGLMPSFNCDELSLNYVYSFTHPSREGTVTGIKKEEKKKDKESLGEWILKGVIRIIIVEPAAGLATVATDIAATLTDPVILNSIFNDSAGAQALYNLWVFVRDMLNLFFIFILLFSALATVFQVRKYHLIESKILIMTIIMAFLVNFSWPITRAIMDAGNITMYHLLSSFTKDAAADVPKGEYFFGALGDEAGITTLLADGEKNDVRSQVAIGVFLFVYAITFFVIAALFLIRTVMFIVLLIFSPIGFAAAIFPGTRDISDLWWSNLIKWTLMGPVMVLMVYISVVFIIKVREASIIAHGYGFSSKGLISDGVIYASGIVMLWSSILIANELSGSASSAVGKAVGGARSARNGMLKLMKRGAKAGAVGGAALVGSTGMALDNRLGNKLAKLSGAVLGARDRFRSIDQEQKKHFDVARDKAAAIARGGLYADSADQEAILTYEKELSGALSDVLIRLADANNKNESERTAARNILKRKGKITSKDEFVSAINAMRDSTKDIKTLFKNIVSEDFVNDMHGADYTRIREMLNRHNNSNNVKDLDKLYVQAGKADIVYDANLNNGHEEALNITTKHIKTASDLAKQTEFIRKVNENANIKSYIAENFAKYPALMEQLLKDSKIDIRRMIYDLRSNEEERREEERGGGDGDGRREEGGGGDGGGRREEGSGGGGDGGGRREEEGGGGDGDVAGFRELEERNKLIRDIIDDESAIMTPEEFKRLNELNEAINEKGSMVMNSSQLDEYNKLVRKNERAKNLEAFAKKEPANLSAEDLKKIKQKQRKSDGE